MDILSRTLEPQDVNISLHLNMIDVTLISVSNLFDFHAMIYQRYYINSSKHWQALTHTITNESTAYGKLIMNSFLG